MFNADGLIDTDALTSCNYITCKEFITIFRNCNKLCVMHITCRSLAANFDAVFDLIVNDVNSKFDAIVIMKT